MMLERQRRYQTGLEAEDRAARFLSALGFRELDRRARMKGGEIDLVVADENTLIFVEVKARKTLAQGAESVTPRQQARIRAGLVAWLAIHDGEGRLAATKSIRCDVIVVAPGREPVHIPNAFPAADEAGDF